MVKNLPQVDSQTQEDIDKHLEHLGDEWSNKSSLEEVLNDFLFPYINESTNVLEIGSGGGRNL